MITISSDALTVCVDTHGAELVSAKDTKGREYIWTADEVWQRHAPVLFPFVCNTKTKKYTVHGKEYSLGNHGFARDSEFALVSQEKDRVTLRLVSSKDTLSRYPFPFELDVTYTVEGNSIKCLFAVKNTGSEEMPFFIGGHPGFLCPFEDDSSFEDYDVVYEKAETVVQHLDGGDVTVCSDSTTVPVTRELFANDVFLKDKPASSRISLVNRKTGHSISVSYDNSGCIAVWSPYDDRASFVCLEPWAAAPVYCCDTEELCDMPHAKRLAPGESYDFPFGIEFDI